MQRRNFLKAMGLCFIASQTANSWAQSRSSMVGNIGGTMPIEMTLLVENNIVRGSYSYSATGNRLELEGTKSGTECVLNESYHGAHTGTFRGQLVGEGSGSFQGTWYSADGTKSYPFTLS